MQNVQFVCLVKPAINRCTCHDLNLHCMFNKHAPDYSYHLAGKRSLYVLDPYRLLSYLFCKNFLSAFIGWGRSCYCFSFLFVVSAIRPISTVLVQMEGIRLAVSGSSRASSLSHVTFSSWSHFNFHFSLSGRPLSRGLRMHIQHLLYVHWRESLWILPNVMRKISDW